MIERSNHSSRGVLKTGARIFLSTALATVAGGFAGETPIQQTNLSTPTAETSRVRSPRFHHGKAATVDAFHQAADQTASPLDRAKAWHDLNQSAFPKLEGELKLLLKPVAAEETPEPIGPFMTTKGAVEAVLGPSRTTKVDRQPNPQSSRKLKTLVRVAGLGTTVLFLEAACAGGNPTPKPIETTLPTPIVTPSSLDVTPTVTVSPSPEVTPIPKLYSKNLYDSALVLYQDTDWKKTDYTACIPASTEMMLNFISENGNPGTGFKWKPTNSFDTQEKILAWERAHDTRNTTFPGTDANGWRNGLNKYGWGDIYTNPNEMVYKVEAFDSYDSALKAIVMAIARYNKPVGILAWQGIHAQIITGYEVQGQNPAVSSDFTVDYIYVTDPLKDAGLRNARILDFDFKNYYGTSKDPLRNRFLPFYIDSSPNDDPYTPGTTSSNDGWLNRWVIVAPVR